MIQNTARRARMTLLFVSLIGVALGGCADEPVAYSEVVSLKLSGIKDGDVKNGVASEDKNINTETGNPYGEFLKNATAALGGAAPARVVMTSALVGVDADSKGVLRIDQVFSRLELFISSSAGTYPIGETTELASSTVEIPISEDVDWDGLASMLVQGDFKVGVRGDVNATTSKDWDLKLFLNLTFSAFE